MSQKRLLSEASAPDGENEVRRTASSALNSSIIAVKTESTAPDPTKDTQLGDKDSKDSKASKDLTPPGTTKDTQSGDNNSNVSSASNDSTALATTKDTQTRDNDKISAHLQEAARFLEYPAYNATQYVDHCVTFGLPDVTNRHVNYLDTDNLPALQPMLTGVRSVHFAAGETTVSNAKLGRLMYLLLTYNQSPLHLVDFHCGSYNHAATENLTDVAVKAFSEVFQNLVQVSVIGAKLTDTSLQAFFINCRQLKYLDLSGRTSTRQDMASQPDFALSLSLITQHPNICPALQCLIMHCNLAVKEDAVQEATIRRRGLEIWITRVDRVGTYWFVAYYGGRVVRSAPMSRVKKSGWFKARF